MAARMANTETVESRVPVLQLYRRELPDAGGPGRFRGGVAVEFATVPHKLPIRPAGLNNNCSGVSVPAGRGLSGALPGAAASNVILRGVEPRRAVRRRDGPGRGRADRGARDRGARGEVQLREEAVIDDTLLAAGGAGPA